MEKFLREQSLRQLRHGGENRFRKSPVMALRLEADGTIKGRPKKQWKEVLECNMIARGLQSLDAQWS